MYPIYTDILTLIYKNRYIKNYLYKLIIKKFSFFIPPVVEIQKNIVYN